MRIALMCIFLLGCNTETVKPQVSYEYIKGDRGEQGEPGTNGYNSLIRMVRFTSYAKCKRGGLYLYTGLDYNTNNILDNNEVISSSYLCDGKEN